MEKGKINWAHIGIAQLMACGYVDRVLTTNFDPLLTKACALIGEFPGVYDFAASQVLKFGQLPDKAIFYLHGLFPGFVQLHTEGETREHFKRIKSVFDEVGTRRPWIVVGYSGHSDPVFEHLAARSDFDFRLFWIGHKDAEPPPHVQEGLLAAEKFAYYIRGYDADSFFAKLGQELECFPPAFVSRPFTYVKSRLACLLPFSLPGQEASQDVMDGARRMIKTAIDEVESSKPEGKKANPAAVEALAQRLLMAGQYEAVTKLKPPPGSPPAASLVYAQAWAYLLQGDRLAEEAESTTSDKAHALLVKAADMFEAALRINPEMHEALNNWGIALKDHAKTKTGLEADVLFDKAAEKFEAALRIKPDKHETLNNWGTVLAEQAKTKTGPEADALFAKAADKYEAALRIKPDMHEALTNWGVALANQAKAKTGPEAYALLDKAAEKFQAALRIKPDKHDARNSWGVVLMEKSKTKTVPEAESLLGQARDLFLKVENAFPGRSAYNLACLTALQNNETECRGWLEKSKSAGKLPSKDHIAKDTDLDVFRERPWFVDFLSHLA
jgi:cytochrome c-type biogenesis protein CcmH/NrfG